MKKENIDRLYQLMLDDDEMLMGSQWEEMYCNEHDTPKSILNNFLDIYLATDFVEVDDDLKTTSLANQEEKIMALIKYFEKITKDLREKVNTPLTVKEYTRDFCGGTFYISECPKCSCNLNSNFMQKYCHECGQRLEWEK